MHLTLNVWSLRKYYLSQSASPIYGNYVPDNSIHHFLKSAVLWWFFSHIHNINSLSPVESVACSTTTWTLFVLIIDYGVLLYYYILTGWEQPEVLFLVSAGWKDLPILDNHLFWLNYNLSSRFRISLAMEKLWRSFLLAREAPSACPPSQETGTTSWHQPDAACCGMLMHCLIPDSI